MNLLNQWKKISKFPGHRYWLWLLLKKKVPYSSNIKPEIIAWEPGKLSLRMRERRSVRNHLRSIHAVALMNLCELTSGLCLLSSLPDNIKGIPTKFSIDFKKKARGWISAEAQVVAPEVKERISFPLTVTVRDSTSEVVCSAEVIWVLQPA